jgi:hypothetical protein
MDLFRVWRPIGTNDLAYIAEATRTDALMLSDRALLFEKISEELELLLDSEQLEVEV